MATATEKIINWFKDHEDTFNNCMEQLDSYNGYLSDDRYYSMDELDELFTGESATYILQRAFYGHDSETWTTDEHGEKHYGDFNPNREFFYFNGYGNLVSADYKDYSAYLDHYTVDSMLENRSNIDEIDSDDELSALFDELENEKAEV